MDLSLVVCTRNRGDRLEGCLAALAAIACDRPWELILVDNGSTDHTATVLRAFVAQAPMAAKYVFEAQPGLARARNAGLKAASGGVVAFTDDDCYPAPDFAQATLQAFDDPGLAYLGGRINLFDPDDYPVTINESPTPRRFEPDSFIQAGDVQGACMAIRREPLVAAGAFDPLFGSGAYFPSEDVEAIARLSRNGCRGAYAPEVVVWHHHGRKAHHVPALMKSYDIGRGAYYAKLFVIGRPLFGAIGISRAIRQMFRWPDKARWELYGFFRYFYLRTRSAAAPSAK